MAVKVKKEELTEEGNGGPKETMHIPAGQHPAILVSYVEMGKHYKEFKGKKAEYGSDSKKAGQVKPPELFISLCFEFPTAERTGDRPLTIATSVPMKSGGIMSPLTVSDMLASGDLSRNFAMKTNFMKYLTAMQDATGTDYPSIADYVGQGFLVTVTNNDSKPDKDGNVRTFANMKPDGIQGLSFKHPITGAVEELECPDQEGTYCKILDWDDPNLEEYKKLPEYMQKFINKAEDFPGSPLQGLLKGQPSSDGTKNHSANAEQEVPGKPAEAGDDIPA